MLHRMDDVPKTKRRRRAFGEWTTAKLPDGSFAAWTEHAGWIGGFASEADADFFLEIIEYHVTATRETERELNRLD